MKLGENILKLRKQNGFSQEQLGDKVGVTRQTISNWELNETTPNPEQLKLLSKVLNVSIDELLDNDLKNIIVDKVSNTEKLAGIIIKTLKVFAVVGVIGIALIILAIIIFNVLPSEKSSNNFKKSATLKCSIESNDYTITIGDGNYFDCPECNKEMIIYLKDISDWANIDHSIENINKYFEDNGGICED